MSTWKRKKQRALLHVAQQCIKNNPSYTFTNLQDFQRSLVVKIYEEIGWEEDGKVSYFNLHDENFNRHIIGHTRPPGPPAGNPFNRLPT